MTRGFWISMAVAITGLLASVVTYYFGVKGPSYRVIIARIPFSFSTLEPQDIEFDVDRTKLYDVNVLFKKVFPEEQMNAIIGSFKSKARLNVEWQVYQGTLQIKEGSNLDVGYSRIFREDYIGVQIGTFQAEEGKKYTLSIKTRDLHSEWEKADPMVEVKLNPLAFEDYMLISMVGVVLFCIFLFYFLVLIAGWGWNYRKRKMINT